MKESIIPTQKEPKRPNYISFERGMDSKDGRKERKEHSEQKRKRKKKEKTKTKPNEKLSNPIYHISLKNKNLKKKKKKKKRPETGAFGMHMSY